MVQFRQILFFWNFAIFAKQKQKQKRNKSLQNKTIKTKTKQNITKTKQQTISYLTVHLFPRPAEVLKSF